MLREHVFVTLGGLGPNAPVVPHIIILQVRATFTAMLVAPAAAVGRALPRVPVFVTQAGVVQTAISVRRIISLLACVTDSASLKPPAQRQVLRKYLGPVTEELTPGDSATRLQIIQEIMATVKRALSRLLELALWKWPPSLLSRAAIDCLTLGTASGHLLSVPS